MESARTTFYEVLPYALAILDAFFSFPALLIALVALAGLLLQRASTGEVVRGALKTELGYLLLVVGLGLLAYALVPMNLMLEGALGVPGIVPDSAAMLQDIQDFEWTLMPALTFGGFAVALVLARLTPLRYVPVSGTQVLLLAALVTLVIGDRRVGSGVSTLVGCVLVGIMLVAVPALVQPFVRKATGGTPVAISHAGSAGMIVAGLVGRLVDPRGRSRATDTASDAEDVDATQNTVFVTFAVGTVLGLGLAIASLLRVGEPEAFRVFEATPKEWLGYLMLAGLHGMMLGVGILAAYLGGHLLLGSLVPAFRGIADRAFPGAVPAMDAPILFPFAPNAMLIGFLSSLAGGIATALALAASGVTMGPWIVLPSLVAHLFTGGAAGVIGNATGGRRGAVAGAFVSGILVALLPLLLVSTLRIPGWMDIPFADTDLAWLGALLSLSALDDPMISTLVLLAIGAALLGVAILVQRRIVDAGWDPAPRRKADDAVEVKIIEEKGRARG
ncbi:PTS ascorbate transporter subunit IIC [Brachybacterium sp. JHP9]|uniref:Ascorbate-specific PTS system EIIC component n=1 Tax=Brachybacterium equifaecis TaxID=2910770 RepID=A0ABT0QZ47_9MICO|nr:PTS transporter subunit IIC [Brachybacterium equifaecis]MCL6422932.1 PTS ascorbate transporter subunit IIC [Brachybacterium equifaecis]